MTQQYAKIRGPAPPGGWKVLLLVIGAIWVVAFLLGLVFAHNLAPPHTTNPIPFYPDRVSTASLLATLVAGLSFIPAIAAGVESWRRGPEYVLVTAPVVGEWIDSGETKRRILVDRWHHEQLVVVPPHFLVTTELASVIQSANLSGVTSSRESVRKNKKCHAASSIIC